MPTQCNPNLFAFARANPDYARWLPILHNQLKNMDFSRIHHFLAFSATNDLMH
jgi:hypothetical protein